jgi:hypothetical protein
MRAPLAALALAFGLAATAPAWGEDPSTATASTATVAGSTAPDEPDHDALIERAWQRGETYLAPEDRWPGQAADGGPTPNAIAAFFVAMGLATVFALWRGRDNF